MQEGEKGSVPAKKADGSDITEKNAEGRGLNAGVNDNSPAKTLSCLRSCLPGSLQIEICL